MIVDGVLGPIPVELKGHGGPVTLFAHGLAQSIAGTRPFASGVPGTRVFFPFPAHERRLGMPDWTYGALATDVLAVADATGATQAFGVSLGAGALLTALAVRPDAFEKVVLAIPAVLDDPRGDMAHYERMARLVEAEEWDELAALLVSAHGAQGIPKPWLHVAPPTLAAALRRLPRTPPIGSLDELADVTASVLVIAQEGDPVHPADLGEPLRAALPDARLTVYPTPGLLTAHRASMRALVGGFLGGRAADSSRAH